MRGLERCEGNNSFEGPPDKSKLLLSFSDCRTITDSAGLVFKKVEVESNAQRAPLPTMSPKTTSQSKYFRASTLAGRGMVGCLAATPDGRLACGGQNRLVLSIPGY
jgi:hypothetical protein